MKRESWEAGHQAGESWSGLGGGGGGVVVRAASLSATATLLAAALPRSFITDNEGTVKLSGFSHSRGPSSLSYSFSRFLPRVCALLPSAR